MERISLEEGGEFYDQKYPDGIPTSIQIETSSGRIYDSDFVMYPSGHARNRDADLEDILRNKF